MTSSLDLDAGARVCFSRSPLDLQRGGTLAEWMVPFEVSGADDAPLVLVQGGISANRHVAAWWDPMVGPGRAIDTDRFRVVSIDYLAAGTGDVTSHDQARVTAAVLDSLGVERARAFVGASYGGMVGWAFASLFPDRLEHLVAISAPLRSHPLATAWRSCQRRLLRLGASAGLEREALELARSLGMTTYRGAAEFVSRFADPPRRLDGRWRFPVEDYLEARGRVFAERFTCEALHALSLAIDLHDVDPSTIRTPSTIVGSKSDLLVPLEQLKSLPARLSAPSRFVAIDSPYGHDAFLKEIASLGSVLAEVLR